MPPHRRLIVNALLIPKPGAIALSSNWKVAAVPESTIHPPGTFCWIDLATTDPEAAKVFYTGLFGWTARDLPTDRDEPYTMLFKGDKRVTALFRLAPGMGVHSRWQGYIAVGDVEAGGQRTISLVPAA